MIFFFSRNCYSKRYGPTVRLFDEETAKKSLDLSLTKPMDASRACGRCSGAVFANEEVVSNGRVYHNQCAKCKQCDRKLDAGSICDGADRVRTYDYVL